MNAPSLSPVVEVVLPGQDEHLVSGTDAAGDAARVAISVARARARIACHVVLCAITGRAHLSLGTRDGHTRRKDVLRCFRGARDQRGVRLAVETDAVVEYRAIMQRAFGRVVRVKGQGRIEIFLDRLDFP